MKLRNETPVNWLADRSRLALATALAFAYVSHARAQTPPPAVSPAAPTAPAAAQEPISPPAESDVAPTQLSEPQPAAAEPAVPPPPPPPPPPPGAGPFAEKYVYEQPSDNVTSLTASGGAALSAGNTKSYQVNAGADFQLVRYPHGFGANASFLYGVADVPSDDSDEMIDTVRNLNARARYDFFLSRMDAIFLATAFRWDPFAGIDRRNQGQIGYLRYFFRQDKHRFWGELGYDLTSDDYGIVEGAADPVEPDPEEELIHSARLFLGYENKLSAALSYVGGLEGLLNVEEPGDSRLNFSNAIQSAISESFRLELKLTLAYESEPVEGAQELDTQFLINVIYQLL